MAASGEQYILRMIVDVKNDVALKELQKNIRGTSAELATGNRQMTAGAKSSRQLGYAFQSAGFQISDFAVQVQGGVSATRALSQQLPQLLAGFNILNPAFALTTAVLATLAAMTPTLVRGYQAWARETGILAEETLTLEDALSGIKDTTGNIQATFSTIDFSSWNEQFNSATESTRELYAALLNLSSEELQREVRALRNSLVAEIEGIREMSLSQGVRGSFLGAMFPGSGDAIAERFRENNMQDALGLDNATASRIVELTESLDEGRINTQQYAEQMILLGGSTKGATEEFGELIRKLKEARQAQLDLEQVRKQQQAVQGAVSTGGMLPVDSGGGSGRRGGPGGGDAGPMGPEVTDFERQRFALIKQAEAFEMSLLPAAEQYRIERERLNATVEKYNLTEEQSAALMGQLTDRFRAQADAIREVQYEMTVAQELGKAAFESFDRNFKSFVDGIARGTTDIQDLVKRMAASVVADLMRIYLTQLLTGLFTSFGSATRGSTAGIPTSLNPSAFQAKGGAWQDGMQMFAKGGVVTAPTLFPMARGTGLMGEAGPEVIAPLKRMSNGDMGVGASPINLVINTLPGESAEVSQRGDTVTIDVVRAVVARDIATGGTQINSAISNSYGLQRAGI